MPFGVTSEYYDSDTGMTYIKNTNYTKKEDEENLKKAKTKETSSKTEYF